MYSAKANLDRIQELLDKGWATDISAQDIEEMVEELRELRSALAKLQHSNRH